MQVGPLEVLGKLLGALRLPLRRRRCIASPVAARSRRVHLGRRCISLGRRSSRDNSGGAAAAVFGCG
jgi:hypothetical protein